MSTFKCEQCEYSTMRKSNLVRHKNTHTIKEKVLHITNHTQIIPKSYPNVTLDNKEKCQFCGKIVSNSSSLARHTKSCLMKNKVHDELNELRKIINQKDELLNQKDELLNQKDELLKRADETNAILKSEVAHLKLIVNNSGSIIKTSMSTMAYVIKNYKDAPALESSKDYPAIHFEQDNITFVENLIHEHDHDKLYAHIGNFIIKIYKKEDPNKQSIWNSDTNRLTYLIREIITNNNMDWKVDKKGIKTNKFIIMPILEHIDQQIRDYIENFNIDYHADSVKIAERKMMKLKSGTEILKSIEDKVLNEAILKYIAPYFYLNKTDNTGDV